MGGDAEQQKTDQAGDGLGAAFYVAGNAAGMTFQVKAQGQRVQMFKYRQAHSAHGSLRDLAKHDIAQVGKGGAGEAQQAVGNDEGQG